MKIFALIILGIFVVGTASATYTFPSYEKQIKEKEPIKIEKRYPVSDYLHGYTFRSTENYKKMHPKPQEKFYYRHFSFLKQPQKITCHNSPPKNKLFYVKCR
ncbi:MAG: hypothetical protein WC548_01375 [Candidatus Pacearchaeota archaeon]